MDLLGIIVIVRWIQTFMFGQRLKAFLQTFMFGHLPALSMVDSEPGYSLVLGMIGLSGGDVPTW